MRIFPFRLYRLGLSFKVLTLPVIRGPAMNHCKSSEYPYPVEEFTRYEYPFDGKIKDGGIEKDKYGLLGVNETIT